MLKKFFTPIVIVLASCFSQGHAANLYASAASAPYGCGYKTATDYLDIGGGYIPGSASQFKQISADSEWLCSFKSDFSINYDHLHVAETYSIRQKYLFNGQVVADGQFASGAQDSLTVASATLPKGTPVRIGVIYVVSWNRTNQIDQTSQWPGENMAQSLVFIRTGAVGINQPSKTICVGERSLISSSDPDCISVANRGKVSFENKIKTSVGKKVSINTLVEINNWVVARNVIQMTTGKSAADVDVRIYIHADRDEVVLRSAGGAAYTCPDSVARCLSKP